ncbi:MAG: DUF4230 domain-containing protein [Verrucomicrobiota bacterium]|jgi:hypothetical protein
MFKKAVMVIVPVAVAFALCLFFALRPQNLGFWSGSRAGGATLLRQVQSLSQLVTVKYVMEKFVDVRDSKWYGDNNVLLVAQGVVKAGINLDNLQPADLEVSDKKITITLPHPDIMDAYLDDKNTQVIERTTGFMRKFDKDLEQKTRAQAVEEIRLLAEEHGILKDAQDRAKAQVESLFHQLGFADVEVRTR